MQSRPPSVRPFHLARQPILDRAGELAAYELLFRAEAGSDPALLDPRSATANVILGAFCDLGLADVLGGRPGFVNVDRDTLMGDSISLLPREHVVLELLESIRADPGAVRRVRELALQGYRFALDDVTSMTAIEPMLDLASYIKIDVLQVEGRELEELIAMLRARGGEYQLLAEKVETPEMRKACSDLGFQLFQGYHFARPEIVSGQRLEPSKLGVMRLLALVQTEWKDEELEREIRRHPELVFRLMRVVNSIGLAAAEPVSSLRQALLLLGRRQLRRWVQLLVFTSQGGAERPGAQALRQLAANRANLMERLAGIARPEDREFAERCYLAGLLSLFDALFGSPLPRILEQLSPAPEIRDALLFRAGEIGDLIGLVENIERGEFAAIESSLERLGELDRSAVIEAELGALRSTNDLAAIG